MQGGGNSIAELARVAAASARSEWAARVAARRPVRNYRGVHQRRDRYYAVIWNIHTGRQVWLGSYETPEEAAYAYDAAARVTRGHGAKPNFPVPAWVRAAPAREEVSTDLVLALPTPAARPRRREPAAAVAAQASFDNWLLSASAAAEPQHQQGAPAAVLPHQKQRTVPQPPFTQFFHLEDPATAAAAAANGGTAVVNPSNNPGAYVLTRQNVMQRSSINPASTALSSTDPDVHASLFLFLPAAAATTRHRELPVSAVVADNFSDDDGASSSAPPPVPRLTLDLPGCGGPAGAQ